MKYKVGDKVRVRSDLVDGKYYGGTAVVRNMADMGGMVVTIERVRERTYLIEEGSKGYNWTDEMFESVEEELTAEEAIRLRGEMCAGKPCNNCKLSCENNGMGIECDELEKKHPERAIEILKQYKKDHEKKEVKTEIVDLIKVMKEVYDDETCIYAYEIDVNKDDINDKMRELVKEYSDEQNGKIYAKYERICRVKS